MAHVYLNPPHDSHPFQLHANQKDDQYLKLLHYSSHQSSAAAADSSLSSCPTFLSSTQDRRMIDFEASQQYDQQQQAIRTHDSTYSKVDQLAAQGGSSDVQSSNHQANNKMNNISNNKLPIRKREIGEGSSCTSDNGSSSSSAKWMSSKMRLMHKMINTSSNNCTAATDNESAVKDMQKLQFHHQLHDNIEVNSFNNNSNSNRNCNNTTIRVCSDCNTTTTPLWRSGPRGPKSLCNACGIRKRKARRAMEAAAAAAAADGNGGTIAATTDSAFTKIKLHVKEKKPRTSHVVAQYKKHCRTHNEYDDHHPHHQCQSQRKLCFKDFALNLSSNSALKQVLPQDVEEAATLLMQLSCGFIHT